MEEDEKVKEEAVQIIGNRAKFPRLVVFDLDYTLWPFYCEYCYEDETPHLYPHARGILYALKEKGIDVAIASRSPTADIAAAFLDQLEIRSMFVAEDITTNLDVSLDGCGGVWVTKVLALGYHVPEVLSTTVCAVMNSTQSQIFSSWTHKTEHFQRIHRTTEIPFDSMLFFDDEDRNILAVSKMGVTSILVHNGVTLEALRRGLSDFSQESSSSERSRNR